MVFGPKLGAFFANLMGRDGYLTMDLWWSRTFNRLRGDLIPQPTVEGLAEFKALLGRPGMSDEQAVQAAIPYRDSYAAKDYKNGTDIEKKANTLVKAAIDEINEVPTSASDREFMVATAQRAREMLAERGVDLTMADLQAALWYYEKRLYADLGARASDAIGYEEAINDIVGKSDRPVRSAARADRFAARPGGGARAQPGEAVPQLRKSRAVPESAGFDAGNPADYSRLAGRKVSFPVLVQDTGETATLTVDGAEYLGDLAARRETLRRLVDCIG